MNRRRIGFCGGMDLKRKLPAGELAVCLFGITCFILNIRSALSGAAEGIELCIRSVLPSLLPFMVLSAPVTALLAGEKVPGCRSLCRLCGIPSGSEGLLLSGFLSGYPTGARNAALACRNGSLNRKDAERMIGFCSNCGPAFLFGILRPVFPDIQYLWALWGICILSSLLTAAVLPGKSRSSAAAVSGHIPTLSESMRSALPAAAAACGWIILFKSMTAAVSDFIPKQLPETVKVIFSGFTELAGGCISLYKVPSVGLRFILAACLLSFGGLCVLLQTKAVIGDLSIRGYLRGRLLAVLFAFLLSSTAQFMLIPPDERAAVPGFLTGLAAILILLTAGGNILLEIFRNAVYNRRKATT